MADKWANFLNPDVVRTRFIRTGLFLVAHEMLLSAIKDRIHDFYSNSWTAVGGWKASPDYREKVLSLDPKGKNDPLRASIVWLLRIQAINKDDENTIREMTEERNRLAHELRNVLGGTLDHDFESLFPKLAALIAKIDRWWVVNVEMATDPEFVGTELNQDEVTPGSLMLLKVLNKVALGKDEEAWGIYHEFTSTRDDTNP
ncbi:hypothetical protein JMM59_17015 [Rhodovulum sulfidophilum]|uniref:hypothetical protein n=1 Tax=Rhodovulum sulfidophilum TaxID=35806 RepID=UPI00192298AB|nr:hypothetical protein [Rhodovulum sulfidophilum]MBL3566697.1 hypothetical protein [Rhodovulum sulfidophilum]